MTLSSLPTTRLCTLLGSLALVTLAGCASNTRSSVSPQGEDAKMQLPPGWTEADMQACTIAGTPGKMHEHLAKGVGTWRGNHTMWMAPGMEPMTSPCTSTIEMAMDGRFTKCEMAGEMPGMGPYNGLGYVGFDNVQQKFVGNWMDNHSTGIMNGTGVLSADGKTTTWTYQYMCPIRKRMTAMREVQRYTGDDTMTMEMYGEDAKTGQEFKMMQIDLTRTSRSS